MGCCNCSSFATAAFLELKDVEHVPGINGRHPTFVERYVHWRTCHISACTFIGTLLTLVVAYRIYEEYVSWHLLLTLLPQSMRAHFRSFVIARLVGKVVAEAAPCAAVLVLICAANADHVDSCRKLRQAWLFCFMAPVLVWLIIPFGATVRTDLMQRDVCGSVISGLLQNEMMREYFYKASLSEDPELAAVALAPASNVGRQDWPDWPGTRWCEKNLGTWEEAIFSSHWVENGFAGDIGEPLERTAVFRVSKRRGGVVPPAVHAMAATCGIPRDDRMQYCYKDGKESPFVSQAGLLKPAPPQDQAVPAGASSLVQWKEHSVPFLNHSWAWHATAELGHSHVHGRDLKHRHSTQFGHLAPSSSSKQSLSRTLLRAERHGSSETKGSQLSLEDQSFAAGLVELFAKVDTEAPAEPQEKEGAATQPDQSLRNPENWRKHLPDNFCKSSICAFYIGSIQAARAARLSTMFVVQGIGSLCAALCFGSLFFSTFSVVEGAIYGCVETKKVLPHSCLPGYLAGYATMASLPFILFLLAFISQSLAHPAFAAAVCCFGASKALMMQAADIMRDTRHPKRMLEEFKRNERNQNILLGLTLVFLIIYFLRLCYLATNGNVAYLNVPGVSVTAVDFDPKIILTPSAFLRFVFSWLFVRMLTQMCSVEALLEAIFDAEDDVLYYESKDAKQSHDAIIADWMKLRGIKVNEKSKLLQDDQQEHWRLDPKSLKLVTYKELKQLYQSNPKAKDYKNDAQLTEYWSQTCISDHRCKGETRKGAAQEQQALNARAEAFKQRSATTQHLNAAAGATAAVAASTANVAAKGVGATLAAAEKGIDKVKDVGGAMKKKLPRQMQGKKEVNTERDDLNDLSESDPEADPEKPDQDGQGQAADEEKPKKKGWSPW